MSKLRDMLEPIEDVDEPRLQAGLSDLVRNGLYTQGMITLTEGVFLIDFALGLGASNMTIGFMASLLFLAQLLQIPAVWLVERVRRRKAIAIPVLVLSRLSLFTVCLTPFLARPQNYVGMLLAALSLHMCFSSIGGCCWNSWMHDLIPHARMGTFFSGRQAKMTGLAIVLSLSAGIYIDVCKRAISEDPLSCYGTLFFWGSLMGAISVVYLARVPEPRMAEDVEERNFLDTLRTPFRDGNFRRLIVFLGSWNFAVNLAAPFFTVYMLTILKMEMSTVIGLSILSQGVTLIALRRWGSIIDRFSNKSVLRVCGPIYLLCILAWTFTTIPGRQGMILPLLGIIHVFMGFSSAGVLLATGNIGLKLAPQGMATSYLAANTMVSSLAAGLAPIIGGAFADFFATREMTAMVRWLGPEGERVFYFLDLQHWGFFFFFAFVIGIYAGHRLFMVQESGEVKESVVIQELVASALTDLRHFGTATAMQWLIVFPLHTVSTLTKGLDRLRQYRYIRVWTVRR